MPDRFCDLAATPRAATASEFLVATGVRRLSDDGRRSFNLDRAVSAESGLWRVKALAPTGASGKPSRLRSSQRWVVD
jgi:hypothetical protein